MSKVEFFNKKRKEHFKNFDLKLKRKRSKFIDGILINNFNPTIKLLEMYQYEGEVIKNNERIPQYNKEYLYCNTRTRTLSETRAEIDFLPEEKMFPIIFNIINQLIKFDYHFAVFYAEGQRSPHIIIYDFNELKELTPRQREKAQLEFWRSLIPFYFHNLDKNVWTDEHYVPLEFTPHWKYGTPFNLLFEWLPEQKPKNKNSLVWKHAYSKLRGEGQTHEEAEPNAKIE